MAINRHPTDHRWVRELETFDQVSGRSLGAFVTTGAVGLAVTAILPELEPLSTMNIFAVAAICLSLSVSGLLIIVRRSGFWSLGSIAYIIIMLFHMGALPELLFAPESSSASVNRWIFGQDGRYAALLSAVALGAFSVGFVLFGRDKPPTAIAVLEAPKNGLERAIADVGGALVILSCCLWLKFAIEFGLGPSASYASYLAVAGSAPLSLIYITMGVGGVLWAIDPSTKTTKPAVLLFFLFCVVGFPIGLRGEVLFVVGAVMPILAFRRRMPRMWAVVLASVCLLALTAAISAVRQLDSWKLDELVSAASPASGIAELGASLHVVAVSVGWHSSLGEPLAWGASYWAPIADAINRNLLRQPVDPGLVDLYMSSLVSDRDGQIGGSIIGEAHHNFGAFGAVLLLGSLGSVFGLVGSRLTKSLSWLVTGALLSISTAMHARNSFAAIPILLLVAAFGVTGAWTWNAVKQHGLRSKQRKGTQHASNF